MVHGGPRPSPNGAEVGSVAPRHCAAHPRPAAWREHALERQEDQLDVAEGPRRAARSRTRRAGDQLLWPWRAPSADLLSCPLAPIPTLIAPEIATRRGSPSRECFPLLPCHYRGHAAPGGSVAPIRQTRGVPATRWRIRQGSPIAIAAFGCDHRPAGSIPVLRTATQESSNTPPVAGYLTFSAQTWTRLLPSRRVWQRIDRASRGLARRGTRSRSLGVRVSKLHSRS